MIKPLQNFNLVKVDLQSQVKIKQVNNPPPLAISMFNVTDEVDSLSFQNKTLNLEGRWQSLSKTDTR